MSTKIKLQILGQIVVLNILYISSLNMKIYQLKNTKVSLEKKIGELNISNSLSDQGNQLLKEELGKANLKLEQLQLQSANKIEVGALQLEKAKKANQVYAAQIQELTSREPKGDTECEKVFSLLQDL